MLKGTVGTLLVQKAPTGYFLGNEVTIPMKEFVCYGYIKDLIRCDAKSKRIPHSIVEAVNSARELVYKISLRLALTMWAQRFKRRTPGHFDLSKDQDVRV